MKGLVLPSRGKREKGSFGNKSRNAKRGEKRVRKLVNINTPIFVSRGLCALLLTDQFPLQVMWAQNYITSRAAKSISVPA